MIITYIAGVLAFYVFAAIYAEAGREKSYVAIFMFCVGWPVILLITMGMHAWDYLFVRPFDFINRMANRRKDE